MIASIKLAGLLLAGFITAGAVAAPAESRVKVTIPTKDQVGAPVMPDEIAPVKAPFPMPEFKKPKFPALSVKITEHGAKENELATKSIQAAIDTVSSKGGGTVILPAGKWLTGRVSLKNNVNLHFAEGAEVNFSGNVEDYRPAVFTRNEGVEVMSLGALIYASGQTNIAVTGKGKLIGPPKDCSVRNQVMKSSVIENFIAAQTPVEERVYEGQNGGPIFLPMFISPINCTNVYIEGVTLERTAFWNIVPVYCDGVIIRGVTVNSVGIPRGDGIDIESSRNVLIEYSTLNCGDDCFTMKAGRGDDGMRVSKPTENVVVRFCLAQKGHGGITLGSETAGMIRNLYLHDCVFDGTGTGIRFKTRRPRGGGGENVILERIRMDLTGTAITADMLGARMYVGELADRLPARPINKLTPLFRNVTVKDIIVENAGEFVKITGIPESPFSNFQLENADVNCNKLMRISDAKDFSFKNAAIQSADAGINLLDARNVTFDNVSFKVPGGEIITKLQGDATANIRFQNCTPAQPKDWETTAR
jgi:polygalacturonase